MSIAVSAMTLIGVIGCSAAIAAEKKVAMSPMEEGKKLSFDIKKGNCLACHLIAGGDQAGNIGPPLIAMKARFPDKAVLKAQISDPRAKNPNTIMPPFGPHGVMSAKEIDLVTDFIHTL
jgi:sulfur-oxidizing protein SoxX